MSTQISLAALGDYIVSDQRLLVRLLVALLALSWIIYRCASTCLNYRRDTLYGLKHGCQPPQEIRNRWPFGLDHIKQLLDADANYRLMETLNTFMNDYPTNLCSQFFALGPRGYNSLIPQNVDAILSSSFSDYSFGVRSTVLRPLLGDGIFTQEGGAWKHSRQMLRKQFVRAQYHTLSQFDEHVDNLLARLPEDGTVDLQPLFFDFTLDTSSALLLGKSIYCLRAGPESDSNLFADGFAVAQEGLARRMRIAPFQFLYNPKEFRDACKNVHKFVDSYVSDMRVRSGVEDKPESSYGLLDQMSAETFDDKAIRDQILNVLLAGRDTTACCLSWTIRLLARHPEVMTKLRAEIASVIGACKRPTRNEIKQMPYLAQVVKESLRLYPPIPLNIRQATKTTILPAGGGVDGLSPVLVRKGEIVTFSQYLTARRTNIFGPDAAEYRPERWENPSRALTEGYFPFNHGPRRCLGEEFAVLEIYYVIIALLQTYADISLTEAERNQPLGSERQNVGLVLCCTDGCKVKLSKSVSIPTIKEDCS